MRAGVTGGGGRQIIQHEEGGGVRGVSTEPRGDVNDSKGIANTHRDTHTRK